MGLVILAAFFNLLTVVFSIGSVGSLIPILNLIFETPGTDLGEAAVWKAKLAAMVQSHKLENGSLETLKLVIFGTTILVRYSFPLFNTIRNDEKHKNSISDGGFSIFIKI